MKLHWTLSCLAAAGLMLAGTSLLLAEDAPLKKDGAVLAGPKAGDAETAPQRRFDGQGPRRHPGGPHDGRRAEILHQALRSLDLTDEQKAQIRTILEETRQAMDAYRQEHEQEFKSIHEQMKAAREAQDHDKMRQLHEQLRQLFDNAPVGKGKVIEKVKAVLTPEQAAQLQAKLDEAREKMREHRGDGPMGQRGQREGKGGGEGMSPEQRKEFRERRQRDGKGGGQLDL